MEYRKDAEGNVHSSEVMKLIESNKRLWRKRSHDAIVEAQMEQGKTYGEAIDIADERQLQSLLERGDKW